MRIAVLGANGMLGRAVVSSLQQRFPRSVFGFTRADFDAVNFFGLTNLVYKVSPDVIVNCIGLVKQRPEAADAFQSIAVNALLPHKLQNVCQGIGARLIHFSTDCVFSGQRGCYYEYDRSDAEDLYGQSKYLGEVSDSHNAITLRTSIIGRNPENNLGLLEWFLSQNGKQVKGYRRAMWSGVTTTWLANAVGELIENHPTLNGLYQVTSDFPISKFDLLHLIKAAYKLDIEIVPDDSVFCNRSMVGAKFEQATGIARPAHKDMIVQG